jgi:hypothetical protein
MATEWVIVGVLGGGPLEDPVAIGPYTSEHKAHRDRERLEEAVAASEGEGAPIFAGVERTAPRAGVPELLERLHAEGWDG